MCSNNRRVREKSLKVLIQAFLGFGNVALPLLIPSFLILASSFIPEPDFSKVGPI